MPIDGLLREGTHVGYRWLSAFNWVGFRVGYVVVPEGHPWHGRDSDTIDVPGCRSVTWSGPREGEGGWLVGFDCGHAQDLADPDKADCPIGAFTALMHNAMISSSGLPRSVRTSSYVVNECRKLCRAARAAAGVTNGRR